MSDNIRALLEQVKNGQVDVDAALLKLKIKPIEDLGFAHIDLHRQIRQGVPEVIYGAGKTTEQIIAIISSMLSYGQEQILLTRLAPNVAAEVQEQHQLTYINAAHIGYIGDLPSQKTESAIAVITGGTSDYKVAEECAITAEFYGNTVHRIYDVGVAGIHRLLQHLNTIMSAKVIVVIAGMEGALASVVGGLVDVPVIAVPTSVGYGTAFGGVTALLSMLNSCASGVTVVNIDNGFGAAYTANMINHIGENK